MQQSIEIGRHSYIVGELNHRDGDNITLKIGNFCSIAHNVTINTDCGHCYSSISTFPFKELMGIGNANQTHKGIVTIENDVWVGTGAIIMPGVTIGNGAVVGAYSVVAKDVPPYAIVVGNPAVIKKYRFSEEKIKELLLLEWWNWDDEEIKRRAEWLTQ